MRKLIPLLIMIFSLVAVQQAHAQAKTITGTVTAVSDNSPLPGVSITIQGTTQGTQTDFDGNYSIQASSGDVLSFSYMGMKTQNVTVGDSSTINVALEEDASQLEEVVVTALGIKREEKTLSYAQQTVSAEELTQTRDVNFVNSMQGKAAGVEIRKSSSGPGGSTKIQIRGSKSLSGDSSPLFVIDGIPMVNNRGAQAGMWNGVDQGDGLSGLNPSDIESLSILKGANAAILYGSQGANGVVIITTKSGKEGKATVNINSGFTAESIIELPDLQYRYGSVGGTKESWDMVPGNYDDHYVEDWFSTGLIATNSVSVSGGNDKTQAYFAYGNTSSSGVTPTNDYTKNNVTFKQSTKFFNDKVKVTSNIILSQEETNNRPRAGYYNNPLTALYWFPRDRNINDFQTNYANFNPNRNLEEMNWFVQDHHQSNPWWLINKESQEDHTDRVIASLNLDWDINENLKLLVRANQDYADKSYERRMAANGNTTTVHSNGSWEFSDYTDRSTYFDGILNFNKDLSEKISLTAVAGASYQKTIFRDGVSVNTGGANHGLIYPNEFFFQNLTPNIQVNSTLGSRLEKQSVFANATLGISEMVFIDLAGRNDWASSLATTGNDSYFYPSVGLTGILSEMFEMPDFVSFAKIRGSWAEVGNEVPFNVVNPRHTITASGGVNFNTQAPFTDLNPEIIRTFEIGTDWRMFSGRLGLDFTYYDINSQDQFLSLPAPTESDFTTYFVNAGEITNKGVEITLSGKPIVNDTFSWSTAVNYSKNNNKVVSIHPDINTRGLGGGESVSLSIVEGGSIGDMYSFRFNRDEQGRIILDDGNGRPTKTPTRELYGNAEPDYVVGLSNNMTYKKLSLNFQINGKIGGYVHSQTEAMNDGFGVSERTAVARDRGYENIFAVQNGQTVTQIDPMLYYSDGGGVGGRNGINEAHIYKRTNIRVTQLALTYDFDVEELDWIKNASLSFIGNNLFYIYKDAPFDPESTVSTGASSPGIVAFTTPSTRTYGLNLNLTF
jgi:TonB-linked SusC/RagA family outer membrane protein